MAGADFWPRTGWSAIQGTRDTISGAQATRKAKGAYPDFYPFFEGISEQTYKPIDIEENNKIYAESQAQRKLEREIRAEKRKIIGAEASGDKDAMLAYNKRLRDKQAEMRKFTAETGRTRRSNREQVDLYKVGTVSRAKTNQLRDMPQVDQAKKAKDQRESWQQLNPKPLDSKAERKAIADAKQLAGKYEIKKQSLDSKTVREWYVEKDENIKNLLPKLPNAYTAEQKARTACELRNKYRTDARDMMADIEARKKLDRENPNQTFDELIAHKKTKYSMTKAEAIRDIISSAGRTNKTVNAKFGVKGK